MLRFGTGLLICLLHLTLGARPVQVTIWISGRSGTLLTAGRAAPGHLGVVAHILREEPEGYWIDHQAGRYSGSLPETLAPHAMIPGMALLYTRGLSDFRDSALPWTALNAGILPQYPEEALPWSPDITLDHPDGARIHLLGLLPENTPLRVPPPLLRPLKIRSPQEEMKSRLPALRTSGAFLILALPEEGDPADWSRDFPDIPLFIEPASSQPAVIPLDEGRRLRVRPGLHGRAVIRVTLVWDTVRQRFSNPVAEVEWVRPPDLRPLRIPSAMADALRPLPHEPAPGERRQIWIDTLLQRGNADTALIPVLPDRPPPYPLAPESWRLHFFPEDFVWIPVDVDAEIHRSWRREDFPGHEWTGRQTGPVRILLPAPLAAGGTEDTRLLRRPPSASFFPSPPTPFTARDLLFP